MRAIFHVCVAGTTNPRWQRPVSVCCTYDLRLVSPLQFVSAKQAVVNLGNAAEAHEKELNMNYFVDFAGVAGAIGLSVALALWLEWVTLRGLMRLMPARAVESDATPISLAPVPTGEPRAKAA